MGLFGWLLFFILLPIALIGIIITLFIGAVIFAAIIELFKEILGIEEK
jgi:hypothetical protein